MTPVLIVALDVPDATQALALVQRLGSGCTFYKVGLELFTAEGPAIVRTLVEHGKDVFLDLKLHDIPNTVRGAARSVSRLGARLLTVHASGGEAMLRAAVDGAGNACGVLGVTVLTSLDGPSLAAAWGRDALDAGGEVVRLAGAARASGAHGIVCAGPEVPAVRRAHGDALRVLVPGVRLAGAASHDQSRVTTPRDAADGGASYLVLGRVVTAAPDPPSALEHVRASLS